MKKGGALASMLAAIAMFGCLTGCGGRVTADTVQTNVAVVTGACANQPRHSYGALEEVLARAVETNGCADVVVADATPGSQIGGMGRVGSTANNPTRRAQEEAAIEESLMAACEEALADSSETDVLKALRFAASGLDGCDGESVVCVLHSGLTTAGVLNLASDPDWIYADPQTLASILAEQLPDLSAIDVVYWYDLGAVAGGQDEPDQVTLMYLADMWDAVLTQAGVGRVVFCSAQTSFEENPSEYAVSAVALQRAEKPTLPVDDWEVASAAEEFIEAIESAPVDIPESSVAFVPDTAEFLDIDAARSELSAIATALRDHPEVSVWLTGSCAGCPWSADRGVSLSRRRAEAVADLLIEMGVSPEQLECEGVGDGSNERVQHVSDLASDGTQTEAAQQNRRVVVTRR